ncbi:MAG: ABC-2 family transporter protein [Patescibacteria group bacterium]
MAIRKYFFITKLYFERLFAYRARLLVWQSRDLLSFLIFPFIWLTIYGERTDILGYSKHDMVTYYIVAAVVNLIAMSYIARVTQQAINRGDINGILARPVSFLWYQTTQAVSYKLLGCVTIAFIVLGLKLFWPQLFVLPTDPLQILFFLVSLFLAFVLSHLIMLGIGVSAFWFGEINALDQSHDILRTVFAGQIAPLTFYPQFVQTVGNFLPFKFMSYVPAQIYLGRMNVVESLQAILLAGIWVAVLWIFLSVMYKRALRQYEGVGI